MDINKVLRFIREHYEGEEVEAINDAVSQINDHLNNLFGEKVEQAQTIKELQAQVEGLMSAAKPLVVNMYSNVNGDGSIPRSPDDLTKLQIALLRTPVQSLSAIRNEVIESMREPLEQAYMAGQADEGIDPSYSNAQVYADEAIRNLKTEGE